MRLIPKSFNSRSISANSYIQKPIAAGSLTDNNCRTPYSETWVAINWRMKLPTPESHPDFPLWNLGYSPEQVYDLFFPEEFRFLCNPERAAVCGRFGLPEDRLWRFEFVVKPDEDGEELSHQASLERIVYPYITHDGSRYGYVFQS